MPENKRFHIQAMRDAEALRLRIVDNVITEIEAFYEKYPDLRVNFNFSLEMESRRGKPDAQQKV